MDDICKTYHTLGQHSLVLDNISLTVRSGESCAIVGASGSGKSTLLNILGLLDQPFSGRFILDGCDMTNATSDQRAQMRNRFVGFVFQSFHLVPRLTVLDNVALPLLYRGYSRQQARHAAAVHIERVGLVDRLAHKPAELSGGQRQRVAIARALVTDPSLILADEPTGNLDDESARDVMNFLLELNRTRSVTLILVTHDKRLAALMGRQLLVQNGRVTETLNSGLC